MIQIVKGLNNIKFIKLVDNVDEAIEAIYLNPNENILRLEFRHIDAGVILNLINHPFIKKIKRISFEDDSELINHFSEFNHWTSITFGFDGSNFDFSYQESLTKLGGVWSKKWIGLEHCRSLQEFHVSSFRGHIYQIPQIDRLKKIVLIQPKITTLNGIESAVNLCEVELTMSRVLKDISHFSLKNESLKILTIDSCKKIESFESIANLTGLEQLKILNSGEVESVDFLKSLQVLKFINFNRTKIVYSKAITQLKSQVEIHGV